MASEEAFYRDNEVGEDLGRRWVFFFFFVSLLLGLEYDIRDSLCLSW